MKKTHLLITMLTAFLAMCASAAACSTPVEYSLNETQADLTVGETLQLTVTSTSTAEMSVTYSSDNEAVATVTEAGLITAVSEGSATVTAEVDGQSLTCAVTVKNVSYSYSLNKTSATLEEEETLQLSVTSTPVKELSVEWTTSNGAVATVNNSGLVTAVEEGTATITAKVDGQSLTCAITVEKPPVLYTYKLNHNKYELELGKALGLELTVTPEIPDMQLTWESADPSIATVTEEGVVTAIKKGKVKIHAKISGTTVASCEINAFVYEYNFEKTLTVNYGDEKAALPVTITPNKDINISYEVTAGSSISIDNDGKITTESVGATTVTINDGETVIGTCVVTVVPVIEIEEEVQLHVGDTHVINVVASPEDPSLVVTYEITAGDAVTLSADNKTLTAAKNGVATVKVTAGDKEVYCKVIVDSVNATVTNTDLTTGNTLTLSGNDVEYWEQYIEREINHKAIVSEEERIITREFVTGKVGYFPDYAKLIWTDGDKNCAKPSKPEGWAEGAQLAVRSEGDEEVKAQLTVKVFEGKSTIKLYTGVFKGTNTVTLYHGETALASYVVKDNDTHIRNLLTFEVDVEEAAELKIVLALTDPRADNSFLSLVAASVTGDTYQLEKSGARVAPNGSTQIVVKENGEAVTAGVTYRSENTDIATVDNSGNVTGVALGNTRIVVTVNDRVRYFEVEVGYAYTLDKTELLLHSGDTQKINVVSDPAGADVSGATFSSDNEEVATVGTDGTVTAVANGTATITVIIGDKSLTCNVKVNDVVASSSVEKLVKDKNHTYDITDGAEYWEQYINTEVNHKQYKNVEEDIINVTNTQGGAYLPDYAAFLTWQGGATGATCDCGHCNKDTQNGGDGGWTSDGNKAYSLNVKGQVISIAVKVFTGESVIKVYTGGYNLKGQATLKEGGEILATASFDNTGAHNSQCIAFTVNSNKDTEVTIELVMADDNGNHPHSCITLAAVSVSGSTYQLKEAQKRLVPGESVDIEVLKDGVAAGNATYEIESGSEYITLEGNKVTAKTAGEARVKVTVDGRVRYFTVNVGYNYSLKEANATIKIGSTYQIEVVSEPAGSREEVTYASNDTAIATVNNDGIVTGVAKGNTTIKVTVEGRDYTFNVIVADMNVKTQGENIRDQFVDLTQNNVVYYEHYVYSELATKKLGENGKDLIDFTPEQKGDAGYNAYIYFADADGVKSAAGNDKADRKFHKFENDISAAVTVPAGTHEIRVYTGAWEASVKTSLFDGEQEIGSYEFNTPSQGSAYVVTFTVTVEAEKTFTVKLSKNSGNCGRLAAISIATPDTEIAPTATVTATATETQGDTVTKVNLSEKGNLDWIYYNTEFGDGNNGNIAKKADGNYINNEKISAWNEWNYRAGITWADGDGNFNATEHPDGHTGDIGEGYHNNFVADDLRLLATVKVDENVSAITLYATGWQSTYNVFVYDSNGNLLIDQVVCPETNGDNRAYEVTLNVSTTQAQTLRVGIYKVNGNNIGLSAIAVSGTKA